MLPIISTAEFKKNFSEKFIILDARAGRDAHQKYLESRIKGARFVDLAEDLAEIGKNTAFGADIRFQVLKSLVTLFLV